MTTKRGKEVGLHIASLHVWQPTGMRVVLDA
jgi:hypothetical protein